jgi:hypothetical protein
VGEAGRKRNLGRQKEEGRKGRIRIKQERKAEIFGEQ